MAPGSQRASFRNWHNGTDLQELPISYSSTKVGGPGPQVMSVGTETKGMGCYGFASMHRSLWDSAILSWCLWAQSSATERPLFQRLT